MLRVPASPLAGSSATQPLPLSGVRPSAVLVQATASRKHRAPKSKGVHKRADGVRTTAGKGFGNTDPGSLRSTTDRPSQSNAPRFARDENNSSSASLGQHISKASQELQQKQQGQQQGQQEQQEQGGRDDQTYMDQLQQIDANMQQTEERAKQALEEAMHPPSVSDVPKPHRPDREAVKAAQPENVHHVKGFGFSKGINNNPLDSTDFVDSTDKLAALNLQLPSDEDVSKWQTAPARPATSSSAAQRSGSGSKEEAHEKLVQAEQLPQPRRGPESAGIAPVELHGEQQVFTGPQAPNNTQDSSGGLPDQQRTETTADGTAAMGSKPAPPAGGLRGEELSGKGDQQRYTALEREAGETAAPSSSKGSSGSTGSSEHASAHDVAVGAVDKVEAAVKQAAGATKHGAEVVAHEAGDAAVAGLNKLGEVGGQVADKVRPVLADAKAAVQGEGRQQEGQQQQRDSGSGSQPSGGERHVLGISDNVDRTAQAADRMAAHASGGDKGSDKAGSMQQQLKDAEEDRRQVADQRQQALQRLEQMRQQLRSQGPGGYAFDNAATAGSAGGSAMPPAGAALAGGPVSNTGNAYIDSRDSSDSSAELQAEIKQLESEIQEAKEVEDQLDQRISEVKAQQAEPGKSTGGGVGSVSSGGSGGSMAFSAGGSGSGKGANSSREAEMARLGGGAGGSGGSSSGGGGGSGGRGNGSGRGGETSGAGAGGNGEGLPQWVLPAAGVALAFAVYKMTIGKKKEEDLDEQIEQGVAAAKQKAKQQAKQQAEKARQAAEKAKQEGISLFGNAKGKAHNAKEEARSKALSASGDLKGKAQSVKEKAAEKAGELKERATEAASGAIDTIKREGGRKDTWLAALGVVVGLGLIFGSSGGNGGSGNGIDEGGYARENEAWRGKSKKGKQVGDVVSGDIGGVSTVAPLDEKYVDYAETYKSGVAASDPGLAGPGANNGV